MAIKIIIANVHLIILLLFGKYTIILLVQFMNVNVINGNGVSVCMSNCCVISKQQMSY